MWDAQTGQPLTEPLKHDGWVTSAQFSPDGKRVVTASGRNDVYGVFSQAVEARVWDAQTGQPLTEPLRHDQAIFAQFSRDGKHVVTASRDAARVWDIAPPSAGHPGWLLQLGTAVCGEELSTQGALEEKNQDQVRALGQVRQSLSERTGSDDWLILGRWLLADPSARTISPFSGTTVPEWIKGRFEENMTNSLAELEQWAIANGDAALLETVSQAWRAAESAEAARASAQRSAQLRSQLIGLGCNPTAKSLNSLAWLLATSPREDLRDGRIAVILAEKAVVATSRKDTVILDTLAAGLAEAGRFAEAANVQREALGLLTAEKSKEDSGSRLKLYESNAPYRDAAANHMVPAADDRMGMAALLGARAQLCAQFAQWTLAAGDLTKATALDPENWNWFMLAPLLLETGDTDGYRKQRHAMLARVGTTNDPNIAQRTAKVCLLLPLDGADLAAAAKLAETAVTFGKEDPLAAYCQFARGLAEYRQGNFAQAVEWTKRALTQPDTEYYHRDIQAYSVLSMALYRLNQAGEAREALRNAAELARAKLPSLDSGDLGHDWYNWIISHTLLREAKGLIENGSKASEEAK